MNRGLHVFFTTVRDGEMKDPKNRRRFLAEQGLSFFHDITMKQVHGDHIIIVDDDYINQTEADGLITNMHYFALFSKASDCPPVLFYDPKNRVIGAAHCGCRGTYACLAQKMVQKMVYVFGSNPKDIKVKIGPGIGLCCYEVDFELDGLDRFGSEFVRGRNVDLHGINKKQLIDVGVGPENISIVNTCTCCDENYFSYQRMGKDHFKNFAGVIALR